MTSGAASGVSALFAGRRPVPDHGRCGLRLAFALWHRGRSGGALQSAPSAAGCRRRVDRQRPLRAAWYQPQASQATRWRAILSLTPLLAIFTFFTSESHPFDHPWAWVRLRPLALDATALGLPAMPAAGVGSWELAETLGMSSILIQSAVLMGLLLLMIRRWGAQLPLGWLTFVFTLNAVGMGIFHGTPWVVAVAGLTGMVADGLYRWLQPDIQQPQQLRLWSALVPVVLYSLYFLALLMLGGIWWPVHLWAGGIALAGVTGWLMSYLILPPALPEPSRATTMQHEA